ncbi:hypothetical protein HZB88_00465 [archaeon]|nr:hypothetical protein [archaeon]
MGGKMIIINGPGWFGKFDAIFAFLFAVICLLVALISIRVYKTTAEGRYKYLGLSFLFISIANFIYSLFTSAVYMHISGPLIGQLDKFDFAFFLHILLTIPAYALLAINLIDIKSKKITALILLLIALLVIFSYQYYLKFHLILFVLLSFLAVLFYKNYQEKKKSGAKLVMLSFYFLATSQIFFLIMPWFHPSYVFANLLQLIGAVCLFLTLLIIKEKQGVK